MVLKFNTWLIMRVIVSLICTFSNIRLQDRRYFFAFSREGKREASERARYAR